MRAVTRSTSAMRFRRSDLCGSQMVRSVCLMLAVIAVALKVAIPVGFMAAAPANDLPFPLVLCTAQGAMVVAPGAPLPGHDDKETGQTKAHDSPCVFAGHGLGAPGPNLLDATHVEFVAYHIQGPSAPAVVLAPGRGLAAPPPPARGPPSLLI